MKIFYSATMVLLIVLNSLSVVAYERTPCWKMYLENGEYIEIYLDLKEHNEYFDKVYSIFYNNNDKYFKLLNFTWQSFKGSPGDDQCFYFLDFVYNNNQAILIYTSGERYVYLDIISFDENFKEISSNRKFLECSGCYMGRIIKKDNGIFINIGGRNGSYYIYKIEDMEASKVWFFIPEFYEEQATKWHYVRKTTNEHFRGIR